MANQPSRLKELFNAALDHPDALSRNAFVERECAGDEALRQHLLALLAAHDHPASVLDAPFVIMDTKSFPAASQTNTNEPAGSTRRNDDHLAGTLIAGKYKLLERIGEGGMGDVWLAQQTEPVKRQVAVKLIKAGMDSKQVLARFEAERQALAMMDHPNIAKVLDGGVWSPSPSAVEGLGVRGLPYFVMELVKGVPVTEYCDLHKLTPKQRLELFVPVCQAIQHAHQKGVIHRDIKPSNVLIAMYDDRPVPKVIDFGVAKATGMDLTNLTLVTGYGSIIGTPEYMSPEQASFNQLDVDTRSDVYALGVLLYELLTGTTPLDRKSLGQAALLEVLRIVREVDAPRPSDKLSAIDTLPSVAANRGTEPAKLPRLIKGELDWIVLKALEKNRSRRYDTAYGFARDIQRYLANEIVEAQPPSRRYRLQKWAARNKVLIAFVAIIVPIYFICMGFATLHWLMAQDSEQRAKVEKQRAEDALQLELNARLTATRERDRAVKAEQEAIAESNRNAKWAEISGDIMRAFTDHRDPLLREVHIGQTLDDIARQLTGKIGGHPDLESQVRVRLGAAYEAVRDFSAAQEQYLRVLEIDRDRKHPEQVFVLKAVARLYVQEYDYALAEPLLLRAEAKLRTHLNEEPKFVHVPIYAGTAYDLGEVLKNRKKFAEAEQILRRSLDVWERLVADQQKRIDQSEREAQGAKSVTSAAPHDLSNLAKTQSLLAEVLLAQKKNNEEAGRLLKAAAEAFDKRPGDKATTYRTEYVLTLQRLGRWATAAGHSEEAISWQAKYAAAIAEKPLVLELGLQEMLNRDWELPDTRVSSYNGTATIGRFSFQAEIPFHRAWLFFAQKVGCDEPFNDTMHYITSTAFILIDEAGPMGTKKSTTFIKQMEKYAIVFTLSRSEEKAESGKEIVWVKGSIVAR